jgi:ubiquinone/menaquinone biosynthesis C-methylase UbiE
MSYFASNTIKKAAQKIYDWLIETLQVLTGRRDALTPPRRKLIEDRNFYRIGNEFFHYFIEMGQLKPDFKVADIGCGIGRMALPLTQFLNTNGRYEGLDIIPGEIDWCKKKITPRFPNFHFQLADVFNKAYNPLGKSKAAQYRFPYEDNVFDFVFLTSVFTHMQPQDMENYFSEVIRVLKGGGRSLITFFLLNKESLSLIQDKKSTLEFKYDISHVARSINEATPESAIAFDEEFVVKLYQERRMIINQPIRYGSWCGRKEFLSYQDILVAVKQSD